MGFKEINSSSEEGNLLAHLFRITYTSYPFQAETYQGEIPNDTHGTAGPIKVSISNEHNNVADNFLEVTAAYDKERRLTDDMNNFTACDQYGVSTFLCQIFICC